jgi:glycogen debranching enzyme
MYKSEWMGLPELQQGEAEHCPGSCPIQAWSHATLIEVAHRLSESNRIQKNRTII